MYPGLVPPDHVLCALRDLDRTIAEEARAGHCPNCAGPLHHAGWDRKPRGIERELPEGCTRRWGLCCGWCRQRVLPDSVLFCGRHVYFKVVLLLVVAARQRTLSPPSLASLRVMFGVSEDTVRRWVRLFLERLPIAPAWLRLRGRLGPLVRDVEVPAGLLDLLLHELGDPDLALVRAARLVPGL